MNPRASPSLPAHIASPDPLLNAAESAPSCALHRRVSLLNGAICRAETVDLLSMVAGNDLAAEDVGVCGLSACACGLGWMRHRGRGVVPYAR